MIDVSFDIFILINRLFELGDEMVQRGTPWYKAKKGGLSVEFKEFFSMMKKRISDELFPVVERMAKGEKIVSYGLKNDGKEMSDFLVIFARL